MTNRWHRAIKTATFKLPDYEYESRRQGAHSIMTTVFSEPGMAEFIEGTLGGLVDLKAIMAWIERTQATGKADMGVFEKQFAKKLLTTVLTRLEAMNLNVGTLATQVLLRFPGLVAKLLAQGAVLEEGENVDMFYDFLDARSFGEILSLLKQWYALNLEDVVGPLVAKAKEAKEQLQAETEPEAKPKAVGPRRMGLASGSSRAGR